MLIKNVNPANNIYLGYCLGGLGLRPGGPGVSGWALGLGEIGLKDPNFKIETCTLGFP